MYRNQPLDFVTAACSSGNRSPSGSPTKAFADAHKATGCEQTMCAQMACGAATASCDSGTCKSTVGALH